MFNDIVPTAGTTIPVAAAIVVSVVTNFVPFEFGCSARAIAFELTQEWIQALALFAVLLLHACSTTITPVPVAAAHIVHVIAVAVALPSRLLARFFPWTALMFAVHAFAFFAKLVIVGFAAAITPVPSTPSVVIFVVARLVAFPDRFGACSFDLFHTTISFRNSAVKALAFLAVFNVAFISAAVASVPRASSDVVVVIAEAIALELGRPASFLDHFDALITFALVCTIPALALFAVAVVVIRSTAISSVPITSSVVVLVVAVLIAFPIRFHATALYGLRALVGRSFEGAVPAFALLAVLVVVARPTAVPSIPVAASVVVVVVAKLVTLVLLSTTPEFAVADTGVALAFESTIEAFAF